MGGWQVRGHEHKTSIYESERRRRKGNRSRQKARVGWKINRDDVALRTKKERERKKKEARKRSISVERESVGKGWTGSIERTSCTF